MIGRIVSICTLLAMFFGAYLFIDNTYLRAIEGKQTATELHQWITSEQLSKIQDRIWTLQDRFPKDMPDTVKEEYRKLLIEQQQLQDKMKIYEVK